MSGLFRSLTRPSLLLILGIVAPLTGLISQPASAQGTHLWSQADLTQFEKGTAQGVELTSDGHLRQGPGLTPLVTTDSTFVWSVAVDKDGAAYLGTGSPATILRIDPKQPGKPFTLFETKDVSVQVVRLGPDGSLYAATLPSGRVYRINPNATAKISENTAPVVFDPAKLTAATEQSAHAHYVWDLAFDATGRLYIATGNPAAVYRVDSAKIDPAKPNAGVAEFFKTDEAHVRSLAWDAKGNLIAGTDGSGLVYRIDSTGKGYVLFEAPRREITSVAVDASGTIYAASVGDKSRNPLPPLPVQGAGGTTITLLQPGSLQQANASASLPDGSEIYALAEGQAPRHLWSAKDEIVYALLSRPDGLLALTGNRGRIYRIQPDGSFADIAHVEAQQALAFTASGNAMLVGAGNTGRFYSLGVTATHEYASQVFDAGALARFGRAEVEPGSRAFHILTRTGDVEQPVRGWTEWQPLNGDAVASPAGRYIQWKAVLAEGGSAGNIGVNYLAVNAAPVVDDLVVVSGARVNAVGSAASQPQSVPIAFAPATANNNLAAIDSSASTPLQAAKDRTAVTARWAAHDDNGDDLTYALYLRGDGESVWRLLKDGITEKAYSFDATQIPDGGYQVKVVASDAPSHTPADALTGEKISPRFEIDTTPPVVSNLIAVQRTANGKSTLAFTFHADDATSPIARAEYSLDAGAWQYIEPVDNLSDARHETYAFSLELPDPKPAEHLITVRAYDRHDNVGLAKAVIPAEGK